MEFKGSYQSSRDLDEKERMLSKEFFPADPTGLIMQLPPKVIELLRLDVSHWNLANVLLDPTPGKAVYYFGSGEKKLTVRYVVSLRDKLCFQLPELINLPPMNFDCCPIFIQVWLMLHNALCYKLEVLDVLWCDYTLSQLLVAWTLFNQFEFKKFKPIGEGPLDLAIFKHIENKPDSLVLDEHGKRLLSLYHTSLMESVPQEKWGYIERSTLNRASPLFKLLNRIGPLVHNNFDLMFTTRLLSNEGFIEGYVDSPSDVVKLEAKRRYDLLIENAGEKEINLWIAPLSFVSVALMADIVPKPEIVAGNIAALCPVVRELRAIVTAKSYMSPEAEGKYLERQKDITENALFYLKRLNIPKQEVVLNVIMSHAIIAYSRVLCDPFFESDKDRLRALPPARIMIKLFRERKSAIEQLFLVNPSTIDKCQTIRVKEKEFLW